MKGLIGGNKMSFRWGKEIKKHGNIFLYGISIMVLIFMAAVLTGFIMLPVYGALYLINNQNYPAFVSVVILILSVYMLGWVFMRYRVRRK